jgi:hypothetical protein
MRKHLFWTICLCATAGRLACAESLPTAKWEPVVEQCAREINLMHGVWRGGKVFLPAYADLTLVVYLASLQGRHPRIAVVPVFNPEPISFRGNHVVFLSTGLILRAGSEKELTEAIRGAKADTEARDLPACAAMAPLAAASFQDVHERLAGQMASYDDVTVRRLRRRNAGEK